jgi:two-component system chemotaxis response regulator CheB
MRTPSDHSSHPTSGKVVPLKTRGASAPDHQHVVCIGASAGGIAALKELVAKLPPDFAAPVCVAMHIAPYRPSALAQILSRTGALRAVQPEDGDVAEPGLIYVAPPDRHLVFLDGRLRLGTGPLEHHTRPAVDPLFRSAALEFGPRALGIVLSGLLGDGTAGMAAIQKRGGLTAVQDPEDAAYADMPASVLRVISVDYSGTPAALAQFAVRSIDRERPDEGRNAMDEQLRLETEVALGKDVTREAVEGFPPSVFSCPDCGGVLWRIDDGETQRYRCRTGHAYSEDSLYLRQEDNLEGALFAAMRVLSENAELTRRLAKRARERNDTALVRRFDARLSELMHSIATIRRALSTETQGIDPQEARARSGE